MKTIRDLFACSVAGLLIGSAFALSIPGTPDVVVQVSPLTHSMNLPATVVVRAIPFADLRVGMVVRYRNPWYGEIPGHNGTFTYSTLHRLVRRNCRGQWIAKGDNNDREDRGIVTEANYMGVVVEGGAK